MIRALRPTDIGAFLTFRSRVPENDALLGPASRAPRLSVSEFVGRSLALQPGRETWLQIEHGQIYGLVAARATFGADVWEIDHLMIAPGVDEDRVCAGLLDHLSDAAVEEGVQKVFLRLPEESPWLGAARQAGFVQYTTERVFVLPSVETAPRPSVPGLRPRRPADHQALFQLYTSSVPGKVRQFEALTLQEWRWADSWGLHNVGPLRPALPRRRRDLLVQQEHQVVAWMPIHVRSRAMAMLLDRRQPLDPGLLLNRALAELPAGGPAAFAVREYQPDLIGPLEERGFVSGESQALLARMLTARVPEPRLVPARVV